MITNRQSLPGSKMLLEILEVCLIEDSSKLAMMASTRLLRIRKKGTSFMSPTGSPNSLRCLTWSDKLKSIPLAHSKTQTFWEESSLRITLTFNDLISF